MANLRDYLWGYEEGTAIVPGEFTVANYSLGSGNGGCCCLWTVPAGKSYAVFEMWSGGGSGGGVCCCQQGGGAGSGGYAIKSTSVNPGDTFTICAGGSNRCVDPSEGNGAEGCSTYICSNGGGGSPSWKFCLCGGRNVSVCRRCQFHGNCYDCCSMCFCCGGIAGCSNSNATPDLHIGGTNGGIHPNQYCFGNAYSVTANAPFTAGGFRPGPGNCRSWHADCGCGMFPGGGGLSANKYDNQCCGGEHGAGGMVYVLFY